MDESLLIPVVGNVMTFGSAIAIVWLVMRNSARKREHEQIMKALETGKEVHGLDLRPRFNIIADLRVGILLLAISAGMFFTGQALESRLTTAFSLVPMFIGLAFIAVPFLSEALADDKDSRVG